MSAFVPRVKMHSSSLPSRLGDPETTAAATGAATGSSPAADATPPTSTPGRRDEGPEGLTLVLTLLAYVAGVLVGILAEFKDTVGNWSTVPRVLYDFLAVVTVLLMVVSFMAAVAGKMLSVSAFCAKLSAILSSVLLVMAITCKLGTWGCVAGVPCAASVAASMLVVWNYRALAQAVSSRVSSCRRHHVEDLRRGSTLPVTTTTP